MPLSDFQETFTECVARCLSVANEDLLRMHVPQNNRIGLF